MTQLVTPPPDYPCLWPDGQRRTTSRTSSRFKTTHAVALKNIRVELEGLAKDSRKPIRFMVITTNATFQNAAPADPSVAVWFYWCEEWNCIAVDTYRTLRENLQAIAKVLEAKRVIMRHAGVEFLRASFQRADLVALPPPSGSWCVTLGFVPGDIVTRAEIDARWRKLSKEANGDPALQQRLNVARDKGRAEFPE